MHDESSLYKAVRLKPIINVYKNHLRPFSLHLLTSLYAPYIRNKEYRFVFLCSASHFYTNKGSVKLTFSDKNKSCQYILQP